MEKVTYIRIKTYYFILIDKAKNPLSFLKIHFFPSKSKLSKSKIASSE